MANVTVLRRWGYKEISLRVQASDALYDRQPMKTEDRQSGVVLGEDVGNKVEGNRRPGYEK